MTKRPEPHVIAAKVERWLNDPSRERSISAQIARRLAAGESLEAKAVALQYDCSESLVNLTAFDMRVAGFTIVSRHGNAQAPGWLKVEGPQGSVRTAPTKRMTRPTTAMLPLETNGNGNGKHPAPEPAQMAAPAPGGRNTPAPVRHPMVGGHLQVRAVVMNDQGLEIMALDEDGHAWQLAILGTT